MVNGRMARAATAVCAVAVVGTAAGCGGGGGTDGAGAAGKPAPSASSGAPADDASPAATGKSAARDGQGSGNSSGRVSQQELNSYVLVQTDVPGYKIATLSGPTVNGPDMPPTLSNGRFPPVSPASCQPVYEVTQQGGPFQQYARADALYTTTGVGVLVSLSVYEPAAAGKVLAGVRAALPVCTSFVMPGDATESFEHPKQLPDPHLGDEAVEYGITQRIDDDTFGSGPLDAPFHELVVRKGSVIAWFEVHDFPGKSATMPMDVVKAQLAELP